MISQALRSRTAWPQYTLVIDHVQGDPFASPSSLHVEIPHSLAKFPAQYYKEDCCRIALQDYLTRQVSKQFEQYNFKAKGSGKSPRPCLPGPARNVYNSIHTQRLLFHFPRVFATPRTVLPDKNRQTPAESPAPITHAGPHRNTSSMVSIYGQPSGAAYPSSKFAVNGLTKSLARELGKDNIRVNAVAPGITRTDMVAALPEEMIKPLIATIPLGRVGEPEDVANAFLFLASDMAYSKPHRPPGPA